MEEKLCPACGSSQLKRECYDEFIKEGLGESKKISKVKYRCLDCESEGDFFNENDVVIEKALSDLKTDLVNSLLEEFSLRKISFSAIERSLELPQRTLTKWKNGASSPSAAGVALLKFVKLFPWLLEVAENNFDYDISQKIFMTTAFSKMINKMSFYDSEFKEAGIIATAHSTFTYIYVQKKAESLTADNSFRIENKGQLSIASVF